MKITPVPARKDNYAYLLHSPDSGKALIVDPTEAGPVVDALRARNLTPLSILVTHHHHDHIAGIPELLELYPNTEVIASLADQSVIPHVTRGVVDGETFEFGEFSGQVLETPCHTLGAVTYYFPELKAVFTGDTLFVAGCGRLFEGTAADLLKSIRSLLALPLETRMYCGHEYTRNGLRFGLSLEPNNRASQEKLIRVEELLKKGAPSVPSTLAEELETNIFLRWESEELQAGLKNRFPDFSPDPLWIVGKVRSLKDSF